MKLLIGLIGLIAFALVTVAAAAPYVPQNVRDGQCYTVAGNIPAPADFCGVPIVEAELSGVWSGSPRAPGPTREPEANDVILGDDDPPERIGGVEGQLRALPSGDHLWAAVEYVRQAFGLDLARACALEEAFVSPLPVGDWVDRLRVASGGRIEFLPRQVELGEDYVAIAVDAEANVALAVDASGWHTALALFNC